MDDAIPYDLAVVDVIPCANGWQYILLMEDGSLSLMHLGFGEGGEQVALAKPLPVVSE